MLKHGVVGMKGQRDESLEASGLILQRPQFHQMVDAVFVVLYVSVEHGGVRLESNPVRGASCVQPLIAVNLVIANDVAHAIGKNFRASTGERIYSRRF